MSGWVADAGARVSHVQHGDAVVVSASYVKEADGQGAYSQFVTVPGKYVHKLPQGADMKRAVACDAVATVSRALKKVDSLLQTAAGAPSFAVVGAGPVGHLTAQMLALRECPVTVFDRNPMRLRLFDGTSVSTSENSGDYGDYNVLVEATGDPAALQQMVEYSSPGATLLLLGLPYAHRQFTIQGGSVFDKTMIWSTEPDQSDFQDAMRVLPKLPIDRFTSRVLPLEQYQRAWELYLDGQDIKILLQVS
jgi:threonine dehydrogenase-like Zn-dependent dehydrogenase